MLYSTFRCLVSEEKGGAKTLLNARPSLSCLNLSLLIVWFNCHVFLGGGGGGFVCFFESGSVFMMLQTGGLGVNH